MSQYMYLAAFQKMWVALNSSLSVEINATLMMY